MAVWSHLPNAKHIDAIIADLKVNPKKWAAAWDAALSAARLVDRSAARYAAWDAAWDAALSAARYAVWGAARYAVWGAALSAARYAVWGAIAALVAWDDCSYLLVMTPEQVEVQALLGNHAAILMLPAVIALQ